MKNHFAFFMMEAVMILMITAIFTFINFDNSSNQNNNITNNNKSYIVIEKDQGTRLQYIVDEVSGQMIPEFQDTFSIILRDVDSGKEIEFNNLTDIQYNKCLLGDTITNEELQLYKD